MDKGIDPLCKIDGNSGVSACYVTMMVKMGLSNIFMKIHVTTKHPITGFKFLAAISAKKTRKFNFKDL